MASFSFRLLLAELPSHWQKPKESLDRLYKILAVIRKVWLHKKSILLLQINQNEVNKFKMTQNISRYWYLESNYIVNQALYNCFISI